MATPTTAIQRFDLSMSFNEFSLGMNKRKYIGHRVFPQLQVAAQSAKFRRIKIASQLKKVEDLKRNSDGTYKRDTFEWEQDSYTTEERGAEEPLDDRQLNIYGDEIRAEQINRDRALNRLYLEYEVECAAAAFNTSYFTGDYTVSPATPWSTKASADPLANVDAWREQFIDNCGMEPNALVLDHKALIAMIRTDRVEDLVKYSGRDDPKELARILPQIAELLQVEQLIVAKSPVKNTADEGQTPAFGRIWDPTKALLCRISDSQDLEQPEPCLGRTLLWGGDGVSLPGSDEDGIGIAVEEYREEARRGGVIRARTERELKLLHKPAGLLATSVIAG